MRVELDVTQSILLAPGKGEAIGGSANRRLEILRDDDRLVATWTRFKPRRDGAAPHVHRAHCDLFYVLAGELTFTANGSELCAGAGSWLQVPPGVPHTFAATGSEVARFLDIHTPGCGFGDFVRALNAARDEDELAAARARFDQEPA